MAIVGRRAPLRAPTRLRPWSATGDESRYGACVTQSACRPPSSRVSSPCWPATDWDPGLRNRALIPALHRGVLGISEALALCPKDIDRRPRSPLQTSAARSAWTRPCALLERWLDKRRGSASPGGGGWERLSEGRGLPLKREETHSTQGGRALAEPVRRGRPAPLSRFLAFFAFRGGIFASPRRTGDAFHPRHLPQKEPHERTIG
jgi:hypothetical protein